MNAGDKILVAGVGNIFMGDDAFGVEVARELSQGEVPPSVRVIDFGIRAYDLAFAVTDGYEAVIIVDAVARGEAPGTVYLLELTAKFDNQSSAVDAHGMNPTRILEMVGSLGKAAGRLYLVGCEPSVLECEDGQLGLSYPVRAALPQAVAMIRSLLADLLSAPLPPELSTVTNNELRT